jgi:hypothetical protein
MTVHLDRSQTAHHYPHQDAFISNEQIKSMRDGMRASDVPSIRIPQSKTMIPDISTVTKLGHGALFIHLDPSANSCERQSRPALTSPSPIPKSSELVDITLFLLQASIRPIRHRPTFPPPRPRFPTETQTSGIPTSQITPQLNSFPTESATVAASLPHVQLDISALARRNRPIFGSATA